MADKKKEKPATVPVTSDKPTPPKTLDDLKREAADESGQKPPDISDPGVAEQRKRGRPPKVQVPAKAPPEVPLEVYAMCFKVPFAVTAKLRDCPTWELTDKEANDLAEQCKPALDYYVLPFIGKHFIAIPAIMALVGIGISKAQAEAHYREEQSKKETGKSTVTEKTE